MHRVTDATRALLLALLSLCATGVLSAGSAPVDTGVVVASRDDASERRASDLINRRIERPLPFLAGQSALQSLPNISPRVGVRSSPRIDDLEGDQTAQQTTLSRLRVRLASCQYADIAVTLARASQGPLHQFSTPPPVSFS